MSQGFCQRVLIILKETETGLFLEFLEEFVGFNDSVP
jgi:hypothetical protein